MKKPGRGRWEPSRVQDHLGPGSTHLHTQYIHLTGTDLVVGKKLKKNYARRSYLYLGRSARCVSLCRLGAASA